MRKALLFNWFLIGFQIVLCQSTNYYKNLNLNNFRKEKSFTTSIDFKNVDYEKLNAAIFFVTNEVRKEYNLSFLKYSCLLEKSAQMHAKDMADNNFFDHENRKDKTKKTQNDRAKLIGIINPYLAENIAELFGLQYIPDKNVYIPEKGKFSYKQGGELIPPHTYLSFADALLENWMNSPGHRNNILDTNALQLGCGSFLYIDKNFNDMPMFKAVQNFQWYDDVEKY